MAQTRLCRGVATRVIHAPRMGLQVIACTYHDTVVARREGDVVTLNSAGYRTATTKLRMNQFANEYCNGAYSVSQSSGEWFIRVGDEPQRMFFDGMQFSIGG